MKPYLLFFLASISTLCYAQRYSASKINLVENGLTGEVITFDTSSIKGMNIYERMKHYRVNGISVAIIDSGKLVWTKMYGVADAVSKDSVTTETLFQTASIGKVITALAALHLVKEGRLSLDEDVNQKLTSWKVPESKFTKKEKVTLRRLLHHSAGFTDGYGFAGYSPGDSLPSLLQILKAQPPANNRKALVVNYIPGTQVLYSGGGYLIIQQLIEDLTGTTFANYVEREIFQKLDLKHSRYNLYPDKTDELKIARGHYDDGRIDTGKKYNVYPEQAAAGFWSTSSDIARILIQMQEEYGGRSEKILSRELMRTMLSTQLEFSDRGLGVVLKGAQIAEGFWHSGQNAGYNSLLYASTQTGQGAVIMLNSDGGIELAQEITRGIANAYRWPIMQTRVVEEENPDSLQQHTGSYKSKEGLVFIVGQNQGKLFIQFKEARQASAGQPLQLYHTKQGGYIIREAPDLFYFNFTTVSGKKLIVFHKYGGVQMILEKQD
jgi:CubicO group peptidase (beta-lactamase class C family)